MEHILITYWLAELFLGNLKRGVEWLAAVVVPWIVAAKAAARTKMVEFTREGIAATAVTVMGVICMSTSMVMLPHLVAKSIFLLSLPVIKWCSSGMRWIGLAMGFAYGMFLGVLETLLQWTFLLPQFCELITDWYTWGMQQLVAFVSSFI